MKKVFAIILVFYLAPAASATVSFVPSPPGIINPGESFTIQISSDMDSVAWTGYVGNTSSTVAAVTTMWALPAAGDDASATCYGYSGYCRLTAADWTSLPDSIQSGVQFEGTVQAYKAGVCTIYLYDASWSTPVDSYAFTVLGYLIPAIELSQSQFEFFTWPPGPNPDDQVLEVSNSGDGTLYWEITYEDCDWLDVTPISGSSIGEADQVTLSVDANDLPFGEYSCELTISDPCASNNPQTVQVDLFVECMPLNATTADPVGTAIGDSPEANGSTTYSEWVAAGRPECWCYVAQCRGNADGVTNGSPKGGYWRVSSSDLGILATGYHVKEPPEGVGAANIYYNHPQLGPIPGICANFNRMLNGSPKSGYWHVGADDLNRLATTFLDKDPTVPLNDCGGSIDNTPF